MTEMREERADEEGERGRMEIHEKIKDPNQHQHQHGTSTQH